MIRTLARYTAYVLAVLAIALAATGAAALLPITDPFTAGGLDIVAGAAATLYALDRVPCPCCRKAKP